MDPLTKSFVLIWAFILVFSAPNIASWLFTKETLEDEILSITAPESCRRSRSALYGPRHRTPQPEKSIVYCGYIKTTSAYLALPQSARLGTDRNLREELWEKLKVGCTHKFEVYGFAELIPERAVSDRSLKTIRRVSEPYDCKPEALASES